MFQLGFELSYPRLEASIHPPPLCAAPFCHFQMKIFFGFMFILSFKHHTYPPHFLPFPEIII